MAKYCSHCGKELKDGQKCDCQKDKVSKKEESEKKQETASEMFQTYLDVAKGIYTHPIDTIQKYAKKKNFLLAMIMIAINCLVTGLFAFLLVKELMNYTKEVMGVLSYSIAGNMTSKDVPLTIVFVVFLFMAAGFFTTGGMLTLFAGPVLKTKTSFKQIISLIGVCSVLTTISTLAVIVCMYISIPLALIVLLLAGILYLTYLYHGFMEITEIDRNKLGYIFTASVAVATFVVIYILPKIFS